VAEPLSDIDLQRLIKLCGLLGSAHDGERASAALKVSEFLTIRKLTWADVLVAQEPPLPEVSVTVGGYDPEPAHQERVITWQMVAREILANWESVLRGDRELDFVQSLLQRGRPSLSPGQEKWLRDIAQRAGLTW
jgi:hypothetical protein